MRLLAAVVAAVALLTVSPLAASAQACTVPAGHAVVAESPEVLVTATVQSPRESGERRWIACLRATGRRTQIFEGYNGESESVDARDFVFSGAWVAFEVEGYDRNYGVTTYLLRADLRTGFVDEVTAIFREESFPAVALDAHGTVAWIVERGEERLVRALLTGSVRDLDRGPRAAVDGLAVGDERVRWSRDGAERSVEAPAPCRAAAPERIVTRSTGAVLVTDGRRLRGCVLSDPRMTVLTGRSFALARLAGTKAAFVERSSARERIVVVNLRSGSRWAGGAVRRGRHHLDQLTVDVRGAAAWVRATAGALVLLARDTRGRVRVIDRSVRRGARPSFDHLGHLMWDDGRRTRSLRIG